MALDSFKAYRYLRLKKQVASAKIKLFVNSYFESYGAVMFLVDFINKSIYCIILLISVVCSISVLNWWTANVNRRFKVKDLDCL